jgi:hypothetical protein
MNGSISGALQAFQKSPYLQICQKYSARDRSLVHTPIIPAVVHSLSLSVPLVGATVSGFGQFFGFGPGAGRFASGLHCAAARPDIPRITASFMVRKVSCLCCHLIMGIGGHGEPIKAASHGDLLQPDLAKSFHCTLYCHIISNIDSGSLQL